MKIVDIMRLERNAAAWTHDTPSARRLRISAPLLHRPTSMDGSRDAGGGGRSIVLKAELSQLSVYFSCFRGCEHKRTYILPRACHSICFYSLFGCANIEVYTLCLPVYLHRDARLLYTQRSTHSTHVPEREGVRGALQGKRYGQN